jgi:hypothetical protein
MKERWADIMDDHDKKRPVVRPKVDKTKNIQIVKCKEIPESDVDKDTKNV